MRYSREEYCQLVTTAVQTTQQVTLLAEERLRLVLNREINTYTCIRTTGGDTCSLPQGTRLPSEALQSLKNKAE